MFTAFLIMGFLASARSQENLPDAFFTAKMKARQWIIQHGTPQTASKKQFIEAMGEDSVSFLEDHGLQVRNLDEMAEMSLTSGEALIQPWSGDYWATYKGGIAFPYAHPEFLANSDWRENFRFFEMKVKPDKPFSNPEYLRSLSPAEKYDLLTDDPGLSLTRRAWAEGKRYYESDGKVETWFGICHGWAAASFLVPRPHKSISVSDNENRQILEFRPHDIKALVSQLWANAFPQVLYLGSRCSEKDPPRNENGRVEMARCFDVNPGTFHLILVNKLGLYRENFIMDANFDYEVWNYPVYSYKYSYFNPKTGKEGTNLQEAMIETRGFGEDKFKEYRSPKTRFIVGIVTTVTYMTESFASITNMDNEENNSRGTSQYQYDLELDEQGRIIGGEWHSRTHPDFLWVPVRGTKVSSYADYLAVESWNGLMPIPNGWKSAAAISSHLGQPLVKIVTELVQRAK